MNLLKQLNSTPTSPTSVVSEDGAGGCTGAGSIAGGATMPLFATLVKRTIPKHPRIIQYSNSAVPTSKKKGKKIIGIREAFYKLSEDMQGSDTDPNFNPTEIISKLKSLENKESVDYRDTTTFGLVDSNDAIVRVTLPVDQAEGFEQDLQHYMSDRDETEKTPEIAEILFKLKDRYTIVNVEWPNVEEDAEESQELADQPGAEGGLPGAEGEGMPGAEGGELPGVGELPGAGEDTGQIQSLLTQVIDMMKSDADARKAEAQAREAEAKTRQAGAARDQAMARVKQEEQFMDMDEHTKNQKAKEKEAKRLAQLSKWKHDMAKGQDEERPAQEPQYDFLPGEEDEEYISKRSYPQVDKKDSTIRGRVDSSDIANYIMNRAK